MRKVRVAAAVAIAAALLGLRAAAAPPPADGWRIRFEARMDGVVDQGRLVIGAGTGAVDGRDVFDDAHPPALPHTFLDLVIEHRDDEPGWEDQERPTLRYRAQYDTPLGPRSRSVQFLLETDRTGTVTLSWALATDLDLAQHFATLRDLSTGATVDLREQPSAALDVTPGRRVLQLDLAPGRPAPPIAHNQDVVTNEDTSRAITLTATDPEGDPLTFRIVSAPSHGVLQGVPPTVLYVPAANYYGPDAFTFVANDGNADSDIGTVAIVVLPVNDAPVATPQSVTTDEDTPLAVTLAGTDVEGDALTFTIETPPAHGALTGTPPDVTYAPAADYFGPDSFTFRAHDLAASSAPATVAITVRPVNDPPVAGFTVAGGERNVALWENNIGSVFEGAFVVASSPSQSNLGPVNLLDENTNSRWSTVNGQTTNQFVTIGLPPGPAVPRVSSVRIVNGDLLSQQAMRRFEVWASTTGVADADFTRVLTDVALENNRVQEFPLPAPLEARYLKLVALDNWGSTCCVSVRSFEAISPDLGGVPTFFTIPPNVALATEAARVAAFSSQANTSTRPDLLIDGSTGTRWQSAANQVTNQFVMLELARLKSWRIDRIRLHNTAGNTQSVRGFRIDVSNTTADAGAFSTVLTAEALNINGFQEFVFPGGPVDAHYLQITVLSNFGATTGVGFAELQVATVPGPPQSYSSYNDYTVRPELLLDTGPTTAWMSASGQTTDQFIEFALNPRDTDLLERVRLQAWTGATNDSVRQFEVWVSDTTADDAAFGPVLSATLANNGLLQEFVLPGGPVHARYAKLWLRNTQGSASSMRLSTFEAVTVSSEGHVVSLPANPIEVTGLESPAQIANGATVVAFSTQVSGQTVATMLDYVNSGNWGTTAVANQFATIGLAGSSSHTLAGVRVSGRASGVTDSVRQFEVWVSDTTSDPPAFSQVVTGTVVNDGTIQTFLFPGGPVSARFVRFVPVNNYGHATQISTGNFDVIATSAGGIWTATSDGGTAARPEYALDVNTSTAWRTRTGAVTNQSVKVVLSGGALRTIYGVSVHPEGSGGPRDVQVRVSTTTADDAAFTTVFTGTLAQQDLRRELYFSGPVPARYVQFVWTNGYSASNIAVRELEVLSAPDTGGVLAGFTSQINDTNSPLRALDVDRGTGAWVTATNQVTNQSVTVLLPGSRAWVVDRVGLQPRADCCADQSPHAFEVQVAADDSFQFTTVFTGTLRNDFRIQDFRFPPTPARGVRFLFKDGWGGTQMGMQTIWVYSPELGGATVRFLDRSLARDGNLSSYAWSFGDGSASTDRDPLHTYAAPGLYEVTLVVTDANGLTDEHHLSYRVFGGPTAAFTFTPAVPNEGQSATFTDTSTDPLGIMTREFQWADGSAAAINQTPVTHVFTDNGTYPVLLRVANGHGLTATVTRPVTVANLPPTVDAGANVSIVWNENWPVTSTLSDPGTQDRASLVCTWDFGDGTGTEIAACTTGLSRVAHSWTPPGTYTATLSVRDKDGASVSDTVTVTVNRRITMVNVYAALSGSPTGDVEVAAKLLDRFELNRSMAGKTLTFTIGTTSVNAVTNADGVAVGVLPFLPGVPNTVTASFAGDTFYLPHADTDTFNAVPVFPAIPSLRYDQSEQVALVPSDAGRFANGGVLSTLGFAGGYSPLILVVDPLAVGNPAVPNPLPGFDTVTLNGICDIGSNQFLGNATFKGRVQDFVLRGGKLIIWDSECTNTDYSKFFLPFTTNTPGAQGANGILQIAEENSLSSSNPASPAFIDVNLLGSQTDAVGDSNVFVTFDPNWCVALRARNVTLPELRPVHTYAVLGTGLIIYNGLDRDFMQANASVSPGTGTFYLARIWERELKQPWNPSGLPCDVAATQATITLVPAAAILDVGQTHSVTATVRNLAGNPIPSVFVTLQVTGANPFTQTLTTDAAGAATFTYVGANFGDDSLVARAGAISSNPATAHWNAPPVANAGPDQSVLTSGQVTLDGTGSTDPNPGDVLTYAWTQTAGPPVTLLDANTAHPRFTPTVAADYAFQLTVSDGRLSDTDSVNVHVDLANQPPVALDQSVATDEDTPVVITLGATDPNGDPLTFTILTAPGHGTLTGTGPHRTYTPAANYHGPDTFTFQVNDGTVDSNVATVSITVRPVNDAPAAEDQSVQTDEDTPVNVTLVAADVDGDALTYAVATPPAHGTLTGSGADLVYTPAANYFGPDSFTFTAHDGTVSSNVATVSITVRPVNDAPVANDQLVITDEDTPVSITLTGSDVDGDALTFALADLPGNGTLSGAGDRWVYTPAPNFHGFDTFTFRVNDGTVDSSLATVRIEVRPVNDPPVANDQSGTTDEETPLPITLVAQDVETAALTYTIVTPPQHGTLTGTGADLVYTPAADYSGPDSFTFLANDGEADSNVATVSLTVRPVNDAPVAFDQSVVTDEDTGVPILLTGRDPDGDALTFRVLTQPQHGTLSGTGASLTYTPAPDYFGTDSFTFVVNDGTVDSNTATVNILVRPVNDPPVARDQSVTTDENSPVAITLTATDVEGDALGFTIVTPPAHGTLTGTAPHVTYTPAAGYSGPDSFTFRANDGAADSNVATVGITVRPLNDPPVANNQSVTTDEDTPVAITLTGSDPDGDPLTFTVLTVPAHGTLTGTAPNLTYRPAANYNGPDAFTFRVNDGISNSNVATVNITVKPVNDAPVCTAAFAKPLNKLWPPNHRFERIKVEGITDVEGQVITVRASAVRQDEPVKGNGSGNTAPDAILEPLHVRVERQGGGDGRVYHISFTATDAGGASCTGTVTVCVPHDMGDGHDGGHGHDDDDDRGDNHYDGDGCFDDRRQSYDRSASSSHHDHPGHDSGDDDDDHGDNDDHGDDDDDHHGDDDDHGDHDDDDDHDGPPTCGDQGPRYNSLVSH